MLPLLLTLCMTATAGASEPPLAFDANPVEAALLGPPAKPSMKLRRARKFQTVLRTGAAQGPNFNGHYRVVHWGCGTNCIEWAVVNLETGAVWFAPEPTGSCWAPLEPDTAEVPEWIETRAGSRLMYLHECGTGGTGDRTFDVRHAYEWRDGRPVRLRTESLEVEAGARQ